MMNPLFAFVKILMWPLQKILWPTKIIGKENFKKVDGKGILISNHYSTVDSVIIACNLFHWKMNALVKSEAFKNKFAKWFLTKIGCISVQRGEADLKAVKSVLKVLKAERKILIFPEGTRNKAGTKEMAEFKHGVAVFSMRTGAPVIPQIYYRYHKVFKRNICLIGEPIYLNEVFDHKSTAEEGTAYIRSKMDELRERVNVIAAERGLGD